MNESPILPDANVFAQNAMNTTFTFRFRGVDLATARSLTRECCDHLEYLEARLSRFIEGSDVFRINHLAAGDTLYLSDVCHQCLLHAVDAYARTGGLFDVTLGSQIEHRKTAAESPVPPLAGRLIIHPDVPAVTCEAPGRSLDLGGIGKGFALDQLKEILTGHQLPEALLAAGASSLLAFGPTAWPIDLSLDDDTILTTLADHALSASGTSFQGDHIIHPAGNSAMPADPCQRLWVMAETATLAEIWSTALMLVDPADIPAITEDAHEITAVYTGRRGRLVRVR